jgi:hypothetical protein
MDKFSPLKSLNSISNPDSNTLMELTYEVDTILKGNNIRSTLFQFLLSFEYDRN